jgi:hypothetical protein
LGVIAAVAVNAEVWRIEIRTAPRADTVVGCVDYSAGSEAWRETSGTPGAIGVDQLTGRVCESRASEAAVDVCEIMAEVPQRR